MVRFTHYPLWMTISTYIIVVSLLVARSVFTFRARVLMGPSEEENNEDHNVHEVPHLPSPRTGESLRRRQTVEGWLEVMNLNVERSQKYDPRGRRPLIFVGDSITEALLGLSMGRKKKRAEEAPEAFATFIDGSDFAPLVLGISGDQTQHLLYRLSHGELTPAIKKDESALFVLLIGTNNLGAGYLPSETAAGMVAVVRYLMKAEGNVLVMKLTPRGDGEEKLADLCNRGRRCKDSEKKIPFASFLPAVQKANDLMAQELAGDVESSAGRLQIADCGHIFFPKAPSPSLRGFATAYPPAEVNLELMPDGLHPNGEGYTKIFRCLADQSALFAEKAYMSEASESAGASSFGHRASALAFTKKPREPS